MGRLKTLCCTIVILFIPLTTLAEPETTSPSINRIPSAGSGLSALSMVATPASTELRAELDISDPQFRSLQNLKQAYLKRSMGITRKAVSQQDNSKAAVAAAIKSGQRSASQQLSQSLANLLRPEQLRRLRQVQFQYLTQSRLLEPLAWDSVMMELGLALDEQLQFEQRVLARSETLKKTMVELREKLPATLAALVTPEQRRKLDELRGEHVQATEFSSSAGGRGNISTRGKGLSRLLLRIVRDPRIQKELEVLDDQHAQLSALYAANRRAERNILSTRSREQVEATPRGLGEIGPPEEELEALRKQFDMKVGEILLPHQVKRLRQLDFQLRVAREAVIPLLSETAATAIGLTEEKQQQLQDAYVRESEIFLQERDRVFYEALDELLATLSPEQQKRYHLLVGKRFDKRFQ
ncbi:MAG: hypothetical protein H8E66_08320 [Planctomycetes bacterium]|nr:hypothetical protein [Planctomycetota bacterium]